MRTNKLETRETHIEGRVNNHFAYTWTEGEKGYFNLVKDPQQFFCMVTFILPAPGQKAKKE